MPRTFVPEEQKRVADLTELSDTIRPTPERVVTVESDADGVPNKFYWDGGAEATNADGTSAVASTITEFADGGASEGLWRRIIEPITSSTATTDDLSEGTNNLYYTRERVEDDVDALLSEGNNVTLTYTDNAGSAGDLTIDAATNLDIDDGGTDVATGIDNLDFGSGLAVTDNDGTDSTVTIDASAAAESAANVSEDGTQVVADVDDINFTTNLNVTDDGDGSVTVDASEADIEVLDSTTSQSTNLNSLDFGNLLDVSGTTDDLTVDVNDDLANYDFSNVTTNDLSEPASPTLSDNLYFEISRVYQALRDGSLSTDSDPETNGVLRAGTNVTFTADDGNNALNINSATNLDIDDGGSDVTTGVDAINFGSDLNVTQDTASSITVDVPTELQNVTGVESSSFTIDADGTNPLSLVNNGSGELQVTDGSGNFRDFRVRDLVVEGSETVLNTETVSVADNTIELNSDVGSSTAPSEDGGVRVNRGSETDAAIIWNETEDYWEAGLFGSENEIFLVGQNTTDDVNEGTSNLYFTQSRVFQTLRDGDLSTDVDPETNGKLQAGTNINFNVDDANETITVNSPTNIDIDDSGSDVATGIDNIEFGADLTVTDNTGTTPGKVTVDFGGVAIDEMGQATFSGDGTTQQFTISHSIGAVPNSWMVDAVTDDASSQSHTTADSTQLTVTYDTPPPSGTDNLTLNYLIQA